MNGVYLLLGTNMGNRLENLKKAIRHLMNAKIQIIEESSIYETAAWGIENQEAFLNMVVEVESSFSPIELLEHVLQIENQMGRIRKEKWGARLIDIDLLYYHDEIIESKTLQLPHPGIPERRFTLIPLTELNPFSIHPILKKNQLELLAECPDELACTKTEFKP